MDTPQPRASRWQCRVLEDTRWSAPIPLADEIIVGADPACHITVRDATVSRRHAQLRTVDAGVEITDLASTNGTWLNGQRITTAILCAKTIVRMGQLPLEIAPASNLTVSPSPRTRFGGLVGRSQQMREVFALLELAAASDAPLLIEGESGTGKEIAARAVHDHSKRSGGPFVVVDCTCLSDSLVESQLYGHRKGAFTGAAEARRGAFAAADGGTVFLDEIGDMPLPLQAKLLRVIETGRFTPLGADEERVVDVRIIAATNRDLAAAVSRAAFRFDLFQRLSVLHLRMPPLREHPEDIPDLVRHFYEGRGIDCGPVDGPQCDRLQAYDWPGNVRELRNALERALVLSGDQGPAFAKLPLCVPDAALTTGSVPPLPRCDLPFKEAKAQWNAVFEHHYLRALMARYPSLSEAARHCGINRNHLRALLRKHGLA